MDPALAASPAVVLVPHLLLPVLRSRNTQAFNLIFKLFCLEGCNKTARQCQGHFNSSQCQHIAVLYFFVTWIWKYIYR